MSRERWCAAFGAVLLIAACAAPARAGQAVKTRIDPANVEYSGLDFNGDDYPDGVVVNLVSYEKTLLIGGPRKGYRRVKLSALKEEERTELPDMFTEVDINGDHVSDLIVVNRERLNRYAADEKAFCRVLEYSLYFGDAGGVFRTVRFLSLNEEELGLIVAAARATLLESPPK